MSNEIQTVITVLIVLAMVLLGIRTIKKYGIKSKNSASMFMGLMIGSLVGYYFLNSVICAFVCNRIWAATGDFFSAACRGWILFPTDV